MAGPKEKLGPLFTLRKKTAGAFLAKMGQFGKGLVCKFHFSTPPAARGGGKVERGWACGRKRIGIFLLVGS